jgi:hypothetical protein
VRMTTSVTWSRTGRCLVAASAIGVINISGAPSALAEPVAMCTSDVIDGVEVDYCVGNPTRTLDTDVPGVKVLFEFGLGTGSDSDLVRNRGPGLNHVPRSIESKTVSDCLNGSDVTPSWFPKGWSSQ